MKLLIAATIVLGGVLLGATASAHTVDVCWRIEGDGSVTFFAGTYHPETQNYGGLILDGTTYSFTGSKPFLPRNITACQDLDCNSSLRIVRYQTVNVQGLTCGDHQLSTTTTSAVEWPWSGFCYPQTADICPCTDSDSDSICDESDNCPDTPNPGQEDADADGAGDACDNCPLDAQNDADGDGICGDVDLCADTTLPEGVPTVKLGVNRFADTDGDGVFNTVSPNGVGPQRSYTLEDTAGCSCEQIIAALDLGMGHTKFGCSISAMDDWLAFVEQQLAFVEQQQGQRSAGDDPLEASPQPQACTISTPGKSGPAAPMAALFVVLGLAGFRWSRRRH